jgi:antitoxin ParD1/3/4
MSNISISLPDDVKAYIDEQIAKAGYTSASEYFIALVQREQRQTQAQAALDARLEEGLDSLDRQESIEATEDWWDQERQALIQQYRGQ